MFNKKILIILVSLLYNVKLWYATVSVKELIKNLTHF